MGKFFTSDDGRKFERISSRWVEIKEMVVTRNHSLWDYSDKGIDCGSNGRHPVMYFTFCGRKRAIGEFLKLGTRWIQEEPFSITDGEETVELCAIDSVGAGFDEVYAEVKDAWIRLYRRLA